MEDFDALAAALGAGIADLRGCLILSRDGLVLAGHPRTKEEELKAAWLRFAALGEPERGFVQFGTEIWSYARRGSYASFAVTGIGVRPGLVIDRMEQLLLAVDDARSKHVGLEVPAPASAQQTPAARRKKKRRGLHGDPRTLEEPVVIHSETPGANALPEAPPSASEAAPEAPSEEADRGAEVPLEEAEPGAESPSGPGEAPAAAAPGVGREASGEEDDVDRFSLATEFAGLLQDEPDEADG
jgi:hypothetical protein